MSYSNYIILFNNIENGIKRTYNGMTNNVERRFRQHNGELVGGARATTIAKKKYPGTDWKPIVIISGFCDKSEAMKAEWRIRHPDNRRKKASRFLGDIGRIIGLNYIFETDIKWTKSSGVISSQKLELKIDKDYYDKLNIDNCVKQNIKIELI
jgi:predicted GIY-YIG superfamily endonuclease